MEYEDIDDCCFTCNHWVVRKPPTLAHKLFWFCEKEVVEDIPYDDRIGIIERGQPFKCKYYVRGEIDNQPQAPGAIPRRA
jgi:hypothetical protein